MSLGEFFLDRSLAFEQPIHRLIQFVLVDAVQSKIIRQRCVAESAGHAEFAGCRCDDPRRDHRRHEVARAR